MKRDSDEQLADIAAEFVRQGKSKRRWKTVLGLLFLSYFSVVSYFAIKESDLLEKAFLSASPFVAEVVLAGQIASGGGIDADQAIKLLRSAFSAENAKAVILRINSPGGSPVQSSRIYKAIKRFKLEFNKKLYVVMEDICTSGCYYIAAAGDAIYADESSIVGSIGVILSSFGATEAMQKLGIERRLYTAGKHKGLLDPFSQEDTQATAHIQANILDKSHQNFIQAVKVGRGDKLSTHPDLFTGLIWLGKAAKDLGMIDAIGDADFVAKQVVGVEKRVLYERQKTLLEQLTKASVGAFSPWLLDKITLQ